MSRSQVGLKKYKEEFFMNIIGASFSNTSSTSSYEMEYSFVFFQKSFPPVPGPGTSQKRKYLQPRDLLFLLKFLAKIIC